MNTEDLIQQSNKVTKMKKVFLIFLGGLSLSINITSCGPKPDDFKMENIKSACDCIKMKSDLLKITNDLLEAETDKTKIKGKV